MAIENAKTLNVRIKNKYDSYENWAASGLVLEAGEIAICHTSVDVKVDNGTAKHPALLMKVGDGEKTFANLPWMSAKAADVLAVCKDENELKTFVNGVIADAGIASSDAMEALAGRVTTAEGEIDALQAELNTAEIGLKARVTTAEAAIDALELLVGDTTVNAQIKAYVDGLNLAGTYEAKGEAAKVHTALNEYKTTNDAAVLANTNNITANTNAIAAIKDGTTIDSFADVESALAGKEAAGAAAQALADAKTYADGLAGNYDAKGSAAQALTDAKAYADGLAGNYDAAGAAASAEDAAKKHADDELARLVGSETVSAQISTAITNLDLDNKYDAKGAAAAAESAAKSHADGLNTAMDERVQALEAIDHDHDNKTVLDGITAEKVAAWDAAEQNAKDHADDLDEAMDARMQAVEAKLGTGDGGVDAQIAAAVAAEAKLREDADADLQEQIEANDAEILALQGLVGDKKVSEAIDEAVLVETNRAKGVEGGLETRLAAVEANYATDADVEGLQTQINTIMNNPDAEGAINSINEFTAYVAEHGTIADGMRTDINKNKDDIAAEKTRAEAAEAELEGAINGVAADVEALDGVVATKAAQTDLEAAVTRIGTAEGKITTLEGEMDTAQADIDALELKVGDKAVAEQITDVTNPLAERVVALEAVDHSHANAAELDKFADGDKAKLDAAVQTVTAGTGLTATKTGTDVAIAFDDSVTFIFDCGTSAV